MNSLSRIVLVKHCVIDKEEDKIKVNTKFKKDNVFTGTMDVEFLRHQFEDGHHGVVVRNKFSLGVRHLQLVYMLLCGWTLGALRGSTGIAVLALTDATRRNDTYIQIHNWDGKIQGAILSSFLFGYALMVIPAEMITRRVKTAGKHVLLAALIVSGALAVAMPTIVSKGGWISVCNAQLWMGAAQAFLTPSNQSLLTKFLLPSERNIFSYVVHSGTVLGVIVGLPISGLLSETRLGWELIFYAQAMLALSMACLWGLLTASTPEQHQAMGDTEKEFIREALSCYRKKALEVPWRNILKSHQFWVTAGAHAASNSVFVLFLFYVPTYLMTFGLSMKDSSWQALLPFIALVVRLMTAPTIDWLCRTLRLSFQLNLAYLRKFINALGACGVIAGLTILANLTPSWHRLAVITLIVIMGMLSFQLCGFLDSYKDLSDNFHGTLLMFSRTVASFVGAFVPVVVGIVLGDNFNDLHRWRMVFLCLASLYVVCNLLYTALGSSERQYWDGGVVIKNKFGYHNAMIDLNQVELEELSQTKKQPCEADIVNTTI